MNHAYRLIFNRRLGQYQAVAETACARGGKAGRCAVVALGGLLLAGGALAGPQGGQVVAGQASINQSGNTTTIRQSSQNTTLNWQNFNIGTAESVNFVQPNASAIAVNRILGNSGSQILGSLNANGQVFLINPNGVLFGQGAQINVGGLVASTLEYNASGSNPGSLQFSGSGAGSVSNAGQITAAPGGYVALLGNQVSNTGQILAPGGSVAMGAGKTVTLAMAGNSLLSMQVSQSVANSLASNGGLIQADGGRVMLTAGAQDALLPSVVNNTGVIEARTVNKLPGNIVLLGGMQSGTVNVGGKLDASAPNGGNGGAIETSAATVNIAPQAQVTTLATQGKSGNWLIDPVDFTVAAAGGNQTGAQVSSALGNGNVTITGGNVNVNDPVSWNSSNSLSLVSTGGNVNVNASVTANTSTPPATLVAVSTTGGTLNFGSGGAINMPFVPAGYNGFSLNGTNYTVLKSVNGAAGQALSNLNLLGNYVLGSNLTSGGSFTPLGTFGGDLNGLGHTVSGLSINSGGNVGMISKLTGSVENLGLVGANVTGSGATGNTGALVGVNAGSITNAYVNASSTVTGGASDGLAGTGGLVGSNGDRSGASGNIRTSYAQAGVNAPGGSLAGGLAGVQTAGSIGNSFASGSVSGAQNVGGLLGGLVNGSVSNSYATGSATASGANVGGLIGNMQGATVSNVYSMGRVTGAAAGGLVGVLSGGSCTACFFNLSTAGTSSSAFGTAVTDVQMKSIGTFSAWNPGSNGPWVVYDNLSYPLLTAFMTPVNVSATSTFNGLDQATLSGAAVSYTGLNGLTSASAPAGLAGTVFASNNGGAVINAGGNYTLGGNYPINQFSPMVINGTLTINPAQLSVAGQSVANKTYDGTTTATLTGATLVGVPAGQTAPTLVQTGAFASANAGNGIAVVTNYSLAGAGAANYILNQPGGLSGNITPVALTVTGLTAVSKVYDGTTRATLVGGTLTGMPANGLVPTLVASGSFASANAGAGISVIATSSLTGAGAANYTLTQPTGLSAAITPASLLLTANPVTRIYGQTNPTLTGSVTGLVGSDTLASATSGALSFSTTATPASGVGTYAVTGAGLSATNGNYTLVQAPGNATALGVTPALLTVAGQTAINKTYDSTTNATLSTGTLVGVQNGDVLTLVSGGSFAQAAVGNGIAVTPKDSLTGAAAGNYTLIQPNTMSANITPATLTVTGQTAASKLYDGKTGTTLSGGTVNGVFASDVGNVNLVTVATGNFASPTVGTGIVVKPTTPDTLTGTAASNYTLVQPILLADILPSPAITLAPHVQAYAVAGLIAPPRPLMPNSGAGLATLVDLRGPDAKPPVDPPKALLLQPNNVTQVQSLHLTVQDDGIKLPDKLVKLSAPPVPSN